MTVNDLIDKKDYRNLFILARYLYRIGEPILPDPVYDQLERAVKSSCSDLEPYFNRTYDEDPIPLDLLNELGIKPAVFTDLNAKGDLFKYLDEEKSSSIKAIVSFEEAYEYFMYLKANQQDFVASLKMDGDNTKMLYVDSEFALSVSRGRNGEAFDFTENSAKVMPRFLKNDLKYLKVTGESYVESDKLEYFRNKYNKDKYKTSKSAAISLLRVAHDREDYKFLRTKVFMAEGLADSLHEMFKKLEDAGIETPPYKPFSWQDIPTDYDNFCSWLKAEVLDVMHEQGQGIPSDGVVIEVDDLLWQGVEKNQYSTRQRALKFDHWSFKYDKGIITDIKIEQRRVFKSVRVEIKPVITYDGCEARYINTFDPSILISNDLYVGKEVYFERNSGAVNILIHGEKLKALKASEANQEDE